MEGSAGRRFARRFPRRLQASSWCRGMFFPGSGTAAAGGDCGMLRGSEGKQLPVWLLWLERLIAERALGLCTFNKHPFFRFPLK